MLEQIIKKTMKEFDLMFGECPVGSVKYKKREEIKQFIKENFVPKSELEKGIGVLRQIINEDYKKNLIDNKDIVRWLGVDLEIENNLSDEIKEQILKNINS